VVALGDKLGADHQIGDALFDLADGIAQQQAARQIAGQDGDAGLGEAAGGFLGEAFDAGTDGGEFSLGGAGGAGLGHGFQVAAVVAHELAAEAMLDQ